jgi:hypothetical protein
MYTVKFADEKKFSFTTEQILLIPYFNTLIISSSFIETDEITISSSSIGFEYLHIYATMNEIDIVDPKELYIFAIKQCEYFGYIKLKMLLELRYGFRAGVTEIVDKIGEVSIMKLKYCGKIIMDKIDYPSVIIEKGHESRIFDKSNLLNFYKRYVVRMTYDGCNGMAMGCYQPPKGHYLYTIEPFYDVPLFSTDDEINKIHVARHIEKTKIYYNNLFKLLIANLPDVIVNYKCDEMINSGYGHMIRTTQSHCKYLELKESDEKNIIKLISEEFIFSEKYILKKCGDKEHEIYEIVF